MNLGSLRNEIENQIPGVFTGVNYARVDVVGAKRPRNLLNRCLRGFAAGAPAQAFAASAGSVACTSTISPSMLIETSLLTMNFPSSIASNRMPKSFRLI